MTTAANTLTDPSKEVVDFGANEVQAHFEVDLEPLRTGATFAETTLGGKGYARHLGVAHPLLGNETELEVGKLHPSGFTNATFGVVLGHGRGDDFVPVSSPVGSAHVTNKHIDKYHFVQSPSGGFSSLKFPLKTSASEFEKKRDQTFRNRMLGRWVIPESRNTGTMGNWEMYTPGDVDKNLIASTVGANTKIVATKGGAMHNLLDTNKRMGRPLPAKVTELKDFQGTGPAFVMTPETKTEVAKGLKDALTNDTFTRGLTVRVKQVGTTEGGLGDLPDSISVPVTIRREPYVASDGHPHLTYGQFHKQFVPDSKGGPPGVTDKTAVTHESLHRAIHGNDKKLDYTSASFEELTVDGSDEAGNGGAP